MGSVTASYRFATAWGDVRPSLTWSHEGKKATDSIDSEAIRVDKRGLLSGRVAWELPDGKTQLALYGSNLTNREYAINGLNLFTTALRFYAPPRQFGIEISRDFDF